MLQNKFLKNIPLLVSTLVFSAGIAAAKPKSPLPYDAFDGGFVSAETLGRGGTIASNRATLAAGSENPAALTDSQVSSFYATAQVHSSSSSVTDQSPLKNKVLRYIAMGGQKGVVFFRPMGRVNQNTYTTSAMNSADSTQVDFSADSFGFAGGDKMGRVDVGIALSYVYASLASATHQTGQPDSTTLDTGNGVKMDIGIRSSLGPTMWGILLQNAPGFVWWKNYKSDQLPFKARVGGTWRIAPGVLFSADTEKQFYKEGSQRETLYNVGMESFIHKYYALRFGAFGTELGDPKKRHWTGGLTFKSDTGVELTAGADYFQENEINVTSTLVSLQIPMRVATGGD